MNKLQSIVFKYPVAFGLLIIIPATLLTEIHLENNLFRSMDHQNASYLTGIIEQGGVSLLLVLLLRQLGLLKEAGFTRPGQWKNVWLIWPIFIFSVINGGTSPFDGTLTIDASQPVRIVLFVLLYISVGLFEEFLFRSVTLTLLLRKWGSTRKGIYLAVLVSCSVFGVLHLINLIMGRRSLLSTAAQIVYGTFFGVFFAACFLRNKSVWPVVFSHALFDLCGNFEDIAVGSATFGQIPETTLQGALVAGLITLPLLIYGLFILRKVIPIQGDEPEAEALTAPTTA
jgi:membrane protease YdiL (CAAX protease family)